MKSYYQSPNVEIVCNIGWLLIVMHLYIKTEVPPWYASLRGGVGTVAVKLIRFSYMTKFLPNFILNFY